MCHLKIYQLEIQIEMISLNSNIAKAIFILVCGCVCHAMWIDIKYE